MRYSLTHVVEMAATTCQIQWLSIDTMVLNCLGSNLGSIVFYQGLVTCHLRSSGSKYGSSNEFLMLGDLGVRGISFSGPGHLYQGGACQGLSLESRLQQWEVGKNG